MKKTKRLVLDKEQLRNLNLVCGGTLWPTVVDCDPNFPISNPFVNPGACDPVA
jgi:hypothetical protein